MNNHDQVQGLQLRSLVTPQGTLEISLVGIPTPAPADDEVVVRVEATPLNPSDIGLLFGPADLGTLERSGTGTAAVLQARIPEAAMKGLAARIGQSMPVGNEGAGVVVAAGASAQAQALLGRTVAVMGGAMYSQYRCVKAAQCLAMPEGTRAADAASCFINPLTALGMVRTMRDEGHRALVHTAAASNLGQMLNRLCLKDGIGLVNVVRKPEQAQLLRGQGAVFVCDQSLPTFAQDLTRALEATGATIAFDAVGGGKLAGQILGCMEAALSRQMSGYTRYGSSTHKQVYLYGSLDTTPIEFSRNFGMAWGMGGWLVFNYLGRIEPDAVLAMKQRVVDELHTTFASRYAREISLAQLLEPEQAAFYTRRATGTKVLLNPNKVL